MERTSDRGARVHARALLFSLPVLTLVLTLASACGGSSASPLLGPAPDCTAPPCSETSETSATEPPGSKSGASDASPEAGAADAVAADAGLGAACRRDVECPSGICNWELERCMSGPAPDGTACRRDSECLVGICNWEAEKCLPKQPAGAPCRRDSECASNVCNTALDECS